MAAALIAFVLLLAFFTWPETAYTRPVRSTDASPSQTTENLGTPKASNSEVETAGSPPPPKESYLQSLKIYHQTWTDESLFRMFVRPLGLIILPPVLWAALVQSVTIGFVVAVTSNVASAYSTAYGFEPWQVGLCFFAAMVGSLLGIPAGGQFADMVADWFTKRNGGIRVPEMRLPAMMLSLVTAPLALVLYGLGIERGLHWMCPTIGLGLRKSCPPLWHYYFLYLVSHANTACCSQLFHLPRHERLSCVCHRRLPTGGGRDHPCRDGLQV